MLNRRRSVSLTHEKAGHIKWLLENTDLNHAQIAALVGSINQGRISEIKNGKRFPDVAPIPFEGFSHAAE